MAKPGMEVRTRKAQRFKAQSIAFRRENFLAIKLFNERVASVGIFIQLLIKGVDQIAVQSDTKRDYIFGSHEPAMEFDGEISGSERGRMIVQFFLSAPVQHWNYQVLRYAENASVFRYMLQFPAPATKDPFVWRKIGEAVRQRNEHVREFRRNVRCTLEPLDQIITT